MASVVNATHRVGNVIDASRFDSLRQWKDDERIIFCTPSARAAARSIAKFLDYALASVVRILTNMRIHMLMLSYLLIYGLSVRKQ